MAEARTSILERFRRQIAKGQPIIGGGAGVGLSAKCEELGGIDLIVIYNSGRYRMAGRSSLSGYMPIGDANSVVQELGREVLHVVKGVPVLAGVFASDPFRNLSNLLDDLKRQGFAGIQNFPTMGLIDGQFRQWLEQTGYSYAHEIECIRMAREKEMLTTPYCFTPDEAEAMAKAGADVIVAHMGLTTGGSIGATSGNDLDVSVEKIRAIQAAAKKHRDDVIFLCHGGPIAEPEDARYVLSHAEGIHGFYGASSMERLPTERAIADQIRRFKEITFQGS